jgi:hypothetical protein
MDWIDLAQEQVACYYENNDGLLGFIKCVEMCEELRNCQLSRRTVLV